MIDCNFYNPVNFLGEPATGDEIWNFQNATCDNQIFTLVENATTDAKFYLDKSFSYGDILITIFLSIFLIFGIVKFLFGFIYPFVSFKK